MQTKTIFFSWHSDLPKETNHYAIKGCIEKAVKGTNLSYDEATRNESGAINILDKIYEKISVADIFVCDITTVGKIKKNETVHGLMCLIFWCFTFNFINFVAKFGSDLVKNIKNTFFLP